MELKNLILHARSVGDEAERAFAAGNKEDATRILQELRAKLDILTPSETQPETPAPAETPPSTP